ncbi:alpha/beta fold hydrolase [Sinimarinibacterium sp. CAU 1509]|uniref:alpha/beta fold hydrolase n=1 Tax=Sinimarinibacterium sp. CAU 1509 TaxID=2562283 RepID=UPI0010ABC883|nr:alpha/beta fold hydrolase [Sinimarinibacterium sp. CAU 1509]TJY64808.1 alpha/beta fold hydrolase [Sinimarinibacterium sp. CAU 1509]
MTSLRTALALLLSGLSGAVPAAAAEKADTVVLLHGLARSSASMGSMARVLGHHGYAVVNLDYPSTRAPVEQLVDQVLVPRLSKLTLAPDARVHFVTHSMGGILVRDYLRRYRQPQLGRVVMLAPPNRGSELVDRLGSLAPFRWINGPAGLQLGTGDNHLPQQLGAVDFELGVIAGTRSLNPLYSSLIIGDDDGKVAVARTRVDGMRDFLRVPHTHTFLMSAPEVKRQTLHFLRVGRFDSQAQG